MDIIWSLCLAALYMMVCGPSPLVVPFVLWVVFGAHSVLWELVLGRLDEFQVCVFLIPAVAIITFWVNAGCLWVVEMAFCPAVLREYKIQKDKQVRSPTFSSLIKVVTFNQLFVIVPSAVLMYGIKLVTGFGLAFNETLPSHRDMFLHTVGIVLCNEILFYYIHRLMHHPLLYRHCHKVHHEFTSPTALASIYCHPFEMFAADLVPLFAGTILMNSHVFTVIVWSMFATLGTQTHHCGYKWPWMKYDHQPCFHDLHHEKFNCNYGNIGWLDKLHGTDVAASRPHQSKQL